VTQAITALLDDAPRLTSNADLTGSPKFGFFIDQSDCSPAMHGEFPLHLARSFYTFRPCAYVLALRTYVGPMCTYVVPMCTYVAPMCTYVAPMCTYVAPMCTYVAPMCTYVAPMCTS
jgi:hypothetical protein